MKIMLKIDYVKKFLNWRVSQLIIINKRKLCKNAAEDKEDSATIKRIREEMAADKKALEWREPMKETYNTKLKLFANDEQTSDFIIAMQKPFDPLSWYSNWKQKKEDTERHMQQFIPERHNILGADLAAAHFILYRGGAVKFVNNAKWMKANEDQEFNLPNQYDSKFQLEAIKCDNMLLYYEGLANLRWLRDLKFLSFYNVQTFDDWYLDRVSGSQCPQLEVLDISGTKCTNRGLSCLYRLNSLKLLILDNPKESLETELTCAMLKETLPRLKIVNANSVHDLSEK